MSTPPKVTMYTDGACSGNPGPGGYGVVMMTATKRKELSGASRLTTNNRMELSAVIAGLSELKTRCEVSVYTDSQLIVNAMTKGWLKNWQANNWITSARAKVKNIDLWEKLSALCKEHIVTFNWIRGHNGNPENERADALACAAIKTGIFLD
ncbi:ribonuclease H [Candidatus Magnetominusculus xianensis]|uniref:Ribonuclease H n=2 Tax=Candidatus Magnetominusculus xianensis TaxID=1748249 RepID=A0ABR5SH26_9BACT|nr:ribonuclease HI [Candidatus Magnetominusculus xianensis]KWT86750.1 ribonuclease H [Candidatus Magnetominusculus xianensis]